MQPVLEGDEGGDPEGREEEREKGKGREGNVFFQELQNQLVRSPGSPAYSRCQWRPAKVLLATEQHSPEAVSIDC